MDNFNKISQIAHKYAAKSTKDQLTKMRIETDVENWLFKICNTGWIEKGYLFKWTTATAIRCNIQPCDTKQDSILFMTFDHLTGTTTGTNAISDYDRAMKGI